MRVMMVPHLGGYKAGKDESGIRRVVEAYFKYLPQFGVNLVDPKCLSFDLLAAHAGGQTGDCDVAHCHGLYWTGDYLAPAWEYEINQRVIQSVRHARLVTVPSEWVAESFKRDMHLCPSVVPHGIDWADWQDGGEKQSYVLWNKNRADGICDPQPVMELAARNPEVPFLTTFLPRSAGPAPNVRVTGLVPHDKMKALVQQAAVYLATTKETFGIGMLEAMASGVPVLSYDWGGARDLVQHGVNGYLARPVNLDDLTEGLRYCLEHRKVLGDNGRELAKRWTWEAACRQVAEVYERAMQPEPPSVTVVIPVYNKTSEEVERALTSVCNQRVQFDIAVTVVDDGSTNGIDYERIVGSARAASCNSKIDYRRCEHRGVAHTRNSGIEQTRSKYLCALDADDWLEPDFLSVCVRALEADRSLGIAYTGLRAHKPDGTSSISQWPGAFDPDAQVQGKNQVPTCCVFRREMWERLGGYRQRYAPKGAGSEDAEFWLRAGAIGYGAAKVTEEPLFNYSWLSGQVTGDRQYREVDWRAWHPWTRDGEFPFAAVATPARISHPAHQYDQPVVSVVIPVAPQHGEDVLNALDSLEAQTFRLWEAIVVWDGTDTWTPNHYNRSHPFIRLLYNPTIKGPGYCRNRGAEMARGKFLVFLDADDWLLPPALDRMLDAWKANEAIVYTDYVGKAFIDDPAYLKQAEAEGRLRAVLGGNETVLAHRAAEFECEKALRQPEAPPYIWCNVTALIPRAWHLALGGFDETLPSWEDVDYHWRMARAGRCYYHLPEELMVYRFYSGGRRDAGFDMRHDLMKRLREKYAREGGNDMACRGCGKSNRPRQVASVMNVPSGPAAGGGGGGPATVPLALGGTRIVNDGDLLRAQYTSRNMGMHRVIGPVSRIDYGYRQGGAVFLVHRDDLKSGWFQELKAAPSVPVRLSG